MLSALQVKKGLKRHHETDLAALVEIKPGKEVEVPDCVAWVHLLLSCPDKRFESRKGVGKRIDFSSTCLLMLETNPRNG